MLYGILAALGLALGLSQAVHGFYDESVWAPIALGALVLLLAVAIGAPRRIPLSAVLPLLGLAAWSLISSSWGDSTDSAWAGGNRWLLYAVALALLLRLLAGTRRRAEVLLTAAAGGVLLMAAWMLLQMLRHHGVSLFLGNRLNDPLGYVNGEAGYLLAGVWPCCALAERRWPAPLAGVGIAGIVALVGLGAMTQSRSWEIGLAVSTSLVALALPGRRRRIAILLMAGLAIFAIHLPLARVGNTTVPTDAAVHRAAVAIVLAALISGVVWALLVWLLERAAPAGSAQRGRIKQAATVALVTLAALAGAIVVVNAGRIGHTVRSDYDAFVHLAPGGTSSRLLSGAGNRYDYWRVAWREFRSEPLHGVGAGNYAPGYYRLRRTTESITQPHSLELQTLAELGIVGALLLAAFLAAVAWAAFKAARLATLDRGYRFVAVAGTGLFVGWLVQTSADWEHLIPGLTLIALGAVAALQAVAEEVPTPLAPRARVAVAAVAAALAVAGAILIVPRILTQDALSSARSALRAGDARGAISDATRALQYDGSSVDARVLRAAGFARLDAFTLARADLHRALAEEPQNWVTWALLGDLLTRRGERAAARAAYRHALQLNPLETDLVAR